jgi:hypothetical protein
LERILTNPDLALEMGNNARQIAIKRFSLRRQVDQLVQLWNKLVGNKAKELCQSR